MNNTNTRKATRAKVARGLRAQKASLMQELQEAKAKAEAEAKAAAKAIAKAKAEAVEKCADLIEEEAHKMTWREMRGEEFGERIAELASCVERMMKKGLIEETLFVAVVDIACEFDENEITEKEAVKCLWAIAEELREA